MSSAALIWPSIWASPKWNWTMCWQIGFNSSPNGWSKLARTCGVYIFNNNLFWECSSRNKPKMHLVLVQDKQTTKPNNVCPMSSSKPKMKVQDKQTTKPNNATRCPVANPKCTSKWSSKVALKWVWFGQDLSKDLAKKLGLKMALKWVWKWL